MKLKLSKWWTTEPLEKTVLHKCGLEYYSHKEDIMLWECFNHLYEEGGLKLCFYELRCGLLKIWL